MARLADQKKFKAYFCRHGDFHRVFIEGSDNETLIERIGVMRRESLWLSYSITYFEHHHQASQETHKRIIALFRKGDPDGIELAVRSHILDATDAYVRFLKETYPDLPGAD
jgi:DNA-binding GntR family transcriptional regulator